MLNKLQILLGISFLLVGGIIAANAQIDSGSALRVEIPHPFVIDGKTLPAGKYSISTIETQTGSSDVLKIQSADGKESMLFSTLKKFHNEAADQTALVFDQVDGTYFLKEIRVKGDENGVLIDTKGSEKRTLDAAAEN
jgi:hypothetical protein